MKAICIDPNCNNLAHSRRRCRRHYRKWAAENPEQIVPRGTKWVNPDGTRMRCDIPECDALVAVHGMCKYHYHRFYYESGAGRGRKRYNTTKRTSAQEELAVCGFDECGRSVFNSGLCAGHYYQRNRGQELRPIYEKAPCRVKGCDGEYAVRGANAHLCPKCRATCKRFSLTADQLISLFENRVCSNPGCDSTENLHVDHDHSCCPRTSSGSTSCGKCVRGLLCRSCNLGLGTLQEDPRRIEGLLRYLEGFTR